MAASLVIHHKHSRIFLPMMDKLRRISSRRRMCIPYSPTAQPTSRIDIHWSNSHGVKKASLTWTHRKERILRSDPRFSQDRPWTHCQCQCSVRSYEASHPDLASMDAGSTSHIGTSDSESDKEEEETCPELEEAQMLIAGRNIALAQPRDVDAVIDMYIRQGRLDRDPYWCRPWPSAVALAEEVLCHPELVRGLRVCDLGAGLGLAGVAAALAGPAEVTFYDRESLALLCSLVASHCNIPDLDSNLHVFLPLTSPLSLQALPSFHPIATTLAPLPASSISNSTNEKKPDGNSPSGVAVKEQRVRVRGEMLDWSDPKAGSQDYDVVLACDVLYEKTAVDLIASLVPRLLKKSPTARLLVSDPVERCPENRHKFIRMMEEERGMVLERVEKREPETEGSKQKVELLHFVRQC